VTLSFGPLACNHFLASDFLSMILGKLDPLSLVKQAIFLGILYILEFCVLRSELTSQKFELAGCQLLTHEAT